METWAQISEANKTEGPGLQRRVVKHRLDTPLGVAYPVACGIGEKGAQGNISHIC